MTAARTLLVFLLTAALASLLFFVVIHWNDEPAQEPLPKVWKP